MRSYTLDKADRITAIEGDWAEFSGENGGVKHPHKEYVGHEIWDFISGFETQNFMNMMFFYARRRQIPVSVGYRCDAPWEARAFEMRIEPQADGSITVGHHRLRIPSPAPMDNLISLAELPERPHVCSQCLRVQFNGRWIESFSLPKRFEFNVHYGVCAGCRQHAGDAMHSGAKIVEIAGADR